MGGETSRDASSSASALAADGGGDASHLIGEDAMQMGYHVLGVQRGGPCDGLLVSSFDVIMAADGVEFHQESTAFLDAITSAAKGGRALSLVVLNTKKHEIRNVQLFPKSDWGGSGCLGVTISWGEILDARTQSLRVTGVADGSPSAKARILPEEYIVGTDDGPLRNADEIFDDLEENDTLKIFVYNTGTDTVRFVELSPSEGKLGLHIAEGILHELPHESRMSLGKANPIDPLPGQARDESLITPYGKGAVLERRADGFVAVQLAWGVAYVRPMAGVA